MSYTSMVGVMLGVIGVATHFAEQNPLIPNYPHA
jgi:hypothetical protein